VPAGPADTSVGRFALQPLTTAQTRELQYKRAVDAVINTARVTGQSVLTEITLAGLANAFSSLRMTNYAKFVGKARHHFYRDQTALELLSQLVGYHIFGSRVFQQNKYFKVIDLKRLVGLQQEKAREIERTLAFDSYAEAFVAATPAQMRKETRAKLERRRMAKTGRMY
jgi:hypothetical protein